MACRWPSRGISTPHWPPAPPPFRSGADAPPGFFVDRSWSNWELQTAQRHGLEPEDPLAYHRAFLSVPVPGIAHVVLRGPIHGLGVPGRLVVHRERDDVRPACCWRPSRRPADTTWRHTLREHNVGLEIAGGILAVWSANGWSGHPASFDIDPFCAAAAAAITESQPRPTAPQS